MTNADFVRSLDDEGLAEFIATERYNLARPIFERIGYGIEKQILYLKLLTWLKEEAE